MINKAAILHKAGGNYAFPVDEKTLMIRLKSAKGDLKRVSIIYGSRYPKDGLDPWRRKELKLVACDEEFDYFTTTISLSDSRFRYHFYLEDGQEGCWFNEKGFFKNRPTGFKVGFFQFPYINPGDIFQIPNWVQDAVFYQIFPERFYNGNHANDPDNLKSWGEMPESDTFFGGDLEGIIEKLNYLELLGVNALYLTPIFSSTSNHKYNIDDFYKVDPSFGNKEILKKLVAEAHKRGIRVILDAVFNHSGFNFFAFKDVRENGASSKYSDWFFIDNYPVKTTPPVNYDTFANDVIDMPKLNTSNPEVQDYLLGAAEYWLNEVDIDGWRLDVADEVDHNFWRKFRERVKKIKPNAYIVGEIWHNSEKWLQGDQFDAIMNYPLEMSVLDFFAYKKIGPGEFNNRLVRNWMLYQDRVNYSMLNLLDSHDTRRLINFFSGEKELMKLAVLFQFTYPGAPMIYYGDEVGIEGEDDPDCRRCMVWDIEKQDKDLYKYYQKLISLRHELIPLRRGDYQPILIDEIKNTYGFLRNYEDESIVVIINNSPLSQKYTLAGNLFGYKKEISNYLDDSSFQLGDDKKYIIKISKFKGMILS